MCNSSETALRRGMGSLLDVADLLCNLPPDEQPLIRNISQLYHALSSMIATDGEQHSALVLICSFLNQQFKDTGYLWYVDDDGNLFRKHFSGTTERDAIAVLLGQVSTPTEESVE